MRLISLTWKTNNKIFYFNLEKLVSFQAGENNKGSVVSALGDYSDYQVNESPDEILKKIATNSL